MSLVMDQRHLPVKEKLLLYLYIMARSIHLPLKIVFQNLFFNAWRDSLSCALKLVEERPQVVLHFGISPVKAYEWRYFKSLILWIYNPE